MSGALQSLVSVLARLLLCAIFFFSATGKVTNWSGTLEYMQARGMPMVHAGLPVAVVAEIVGGLALLVGFQTRLGAVLLVAFLIPATLYFHNFWTFPDDQVRMQTIHFLKNLGLMGGLLMLVAHGAGGISVDAFLRRKRRATKAS